jgi:two-component system, NarL family, nitrate/nitrite response regulator NarL
MAVSLPSVHLGEQQSVAGARGIRVLIADETAMGCQLLKKVLTHARFRFEVVSCATDRSEIIQSLRACSAEVALVNESLRDGPFMGFQVLNELRMSFPETKVIILLRSAPHDLVVDAFRAGAKGVFCKAEPIHALFKCIVAVHNGQIGANNQQLHFILEAFVSAAPMRVMNFQRRYLLAKREDDVANLVAEGLSNRAIAEKLGIAEHTVSNYLFKIYEKLGISSRVELVLYVIRQRELHRAGQR